MCKPWPGLRCTDHPHQIIVKLSHAIHGKDKEVSETDELLRKIVSEHGEEGLEENEEHNALLGRKAKLLTEIQVLSDKRETEIFNYGTTAGGRAKLREMIDNSDLTRRERANAQAELNAAEARIAEQKQLGKVLNNKELSDEEKELYAQRELESDNATIQRLQRSYAEMTRNIQTLKEGIGLAREAEDWERMKKLQHQLAIKVTESTIVEKHLAQKKIKRDELRKYIERKYEAGVKKWTHRFDKLVAFLFKLI